MMIIIICAFLIFFALCLSCAFSIVKQAIMNKPFGVDMCVCVSNGNSVFYPSQQEEIVACHLSSLSPVILSSDSFRHGCQTSARARMRTAMLCHNPLRTFISNRTVIVIRVRLRLSQETIVLQDMRALMFRLVLKAIKSVEEKTTDGTEAKRESETPFDNIYLVEHEEDILFIN